MDFRSQSTFRVRRITGTSGTLERDFKIIMANLNREIGNVKGRTTKGLLLAAIEIRRDLESVPPLIPVDYGNLRASFFITTKKNVKSTLKVYEVKNASFKKAESPETLKKLIEGHAMVLKDAEITLAKHDIGVMMGFSAFYAAAVHEMIGAPSGGGINWKRPGSGPKFFQAAFHRNFDKILIIVRNNAYVRP